MGRIFSIHPDNPQARLLRQATSIISTGGIVAYPTDSGYALGCALKNKEGLMRIRSLRQLDARHHMTLVAANLNGLGTYARISTSTYRLIKMLTPGAYTFILNATAWVPQMMLHPKRKTLGFRVPDHPIALALLENLEAPMMSSTLLLPESRIPLAEPDAIKDVLGMQIDLMIDGGCCPYTPTTVVDFTKETPLVIREGKGSLAPFQRG